jgi:DNA polymerase-3 subunit beta
MEFEIEQGRFLSALNLAQTVADRRATMPVLANVLLRAHVGEGKAPGRVTCMTTDMTIALTETLEADVRKAGSLTLGARHLHAVVRSLPDGKLRVTALDNHYAHIVAGKSEFRLMGMPETDFPQPPEAKGAKRFAVPAHLLADLIHKTAFSVSTDEARVNLNGALFESTGQEIVAVSTDGHRLTKLALPFVGLELPGKGVVVPRKGLLELRKVLERVQGDVQLTVTEQHLFVGTDEFTLSIKLNAVTFPPYQQVIPKQYQRRVVVARDVWLSALKRVSELAPEKTATVRVEIAEGTVRLTADNPDLGVARDEIEGELEGEALTAGFNARYLIEAAEAVDTNKLALQFQGELDPCVVVPVDGPDFVAVVMPMRI